MCGTIIDNFFATYERKLINRDLTYKGITIIKKEDIAKLYPYTTNDCLEIKIKKLENALAVIIENCTDKKNLYFYRFYFQMVGKTGFEPATPRSQT